MRLKNPYSLRASFWAHVTLYRILPSLNLSIFEVYIKQIPHFLELLKTVSVNEIQCYPLQKCKHIFSPSDKWIYGSSVKPSRGSKRWVRCVCMWHVAISEPFLSLQCDFCPQTKTADPVLSVDCYIVNLHMYSCTVEHLHASFHFPLCQGRWVKLRPCFISSNEDMQSKDSGDSFPSPLQTLLCPGLIAMG